MDDRSFDPMGIAVDWLEACRSRDLDGLLRLYAADGVHDCRCEGRPLSEGRAGLEHYWSPRLRDALPTAFELVDISFDGQTEGGVVLDYVGFDGRGTRMRFEFGDRGEIKRTICQTVSCARVA